MLRASSLLGPEHDNGRRHAQSTIYTRLLVLPERSYVSSNSLAEHIETCFDRDILDNILIQFDRILIQFDRIESSKKCRPRTEETNAGRNKPCSV